MDTRTYRVLLSLRDARYDLTEIERDLQAQFNIPLLKVVEDALAAWDYAEGLPDLSGLDAFISTAESDDFVQWYEASNRLSRVAEMIRDRMREQLASLIDNSLKGGPPPKLQLVRLMKDALVLDINGMPT